MARAGQPLFIDQRPHRRKIGVGAAKTGVQRAGEQNTSGNIDAAPIAVQADLGPALGAEVGVGRPGDIAEQTRGEPDAAVARRFAREQRRDPVGDRAAVRGEPREAAALELGGDDQRVLRADLPVERLEQQTFAQARRGHRHLGRVDDVDERREQRRRIGERRGAVGRHAGDSLQLVIAHALRGAEQPAQRAARQAMLVEDGERVLGQLEVETRKRPPRSADQIERAPDQISRPTRRTQHLAHRTLEPLRSVLAKRRQAQNAKGKGDAAPDLAVRDLGEFQAAAAQIDRDTMRVGDRRQHPASGRFGFLLAGEQAYRQAGFGGAGDEIGSVGRIAHRGGRDALQVLDLHVPREQRIAA